MTMFQIRLREVGKAEEVLRANFRELNSDTISWNHDFFEGLRWVTLFFVRGIANSKLSAAYLVFSLPRQCSVFLCL